MSSELRENPELRAKIGAVAVHERSLVKVHKGIATIHMLNDVFAQLDPLREILVDTLEGWEPPQLVVIGEESCGKSSLLQRLVMMPIFPTAGETCTRLPIHVRLRNSAQATAPRLEVFSTAANKTVEGPFVVPMETCELDVQDMMNKILQQEHGAASGISTDRIIILHVQGPNVPSLDVVDMPGLTTTKLKKQSRALLDRHVAQHGAYSMYLAVVPVPGRPNTSLAMEFVLAKNLQSQTLGVFSKCDRLNNDSLAEVELLLRDPPDARQGGVVLAPHGWYMTMNKPIPGDGRTAGLRRQAEEEEIFFQQRMPAAMAAGRATSGALVAGLSRMFLEHVRTGWAPLTMRRLKRALERAQRDSAKLGLPVLAGQSAEEVRQARKLATEAARCNIEGGYSNAGQDCYRDVLVPLKPLLEQLVTNKAQVRVEVAADTWKQEAGAVLEECRQGLRTWGQWWRDRLRELAEREEEKQGAQLFVVGRFPQYVDKFVELGGEATRKVEGELEAAMAEEVKRFYAVQSPWSRFKTEMVAGAAVVSVTRESGQLVERVVAILFSGSSTVRDELAAAAKAAAEAVEDSAWAEACGEERNRLMEKVARVEKARHGVLRVLGIAREEELVKVGQVRIEPRLRSSVQDPFRERTAFPLNCSQIGAERRFVAVHSCVLCCAGRREGAGAKAEARRCGSLSPSLPTPRLGPQRRRHVAAHRLPPAVFISQPSVTISQTPTPPLTDLACLQRAVRLRTRNESTS